MTDITLISLEELYADRLESLDDIALCANALAMEVKTYGGGQSISDRLDTNIAIIAKIRKELERREDKRDND